MELYTINPFSFNREIIIEEYESVVWTERFIEAGDMRLVLPATREMARLLKRGTLLNLNTSAELMLIDTRSIEDGMITVSGKTLEAFLDERYVDGFGPQFQSPTWFLKEIVDRMQLRHEAFAAIPGLSTGATPNDDPHWVYETVESGSVHNALLTMAKKYSVGMRIYWVEGTGDNHSLLFSTRYGDDRTRNSSAGNKVIFSPELENFASIKEFSTDVDTKTTVIVYPPDIPSGENLQPMRYTSGVGETDDPFASLPSSPGPGPGPIIPGPPGAGAILRNPFRDRILEEFLTDVTEDQLIGNSMEKQQQLFEIMSARAEAKAKELRHRAVIDGELTSESQYRIWTEKGDLSQPVDPSTYRLGDLVEVAGNFTNPVPAVVTEHIQSSDASGARTYPTLSSPSAKPLPEVGGGGGVTLT